MEGCVLAFSGGCGVICHGNVTESEKTCSLFRRGAFGLRRRTALRSRLPFPRVFSIRVSGRSLKLPTADMDFALRRDWIFFAAQSIKILTCNLESMAIKIKMFAIERFPKDFK